MTPYEPEQRITISRQGAKPVPGHVVRDDGGKRLMVFDEALRENRVVLRECVSLEPPGGIFSEGVDASHVGAV